MKHWISMTAGLALCAVSVQANPEAFREVAATASRIEQDALAISKELRAKERDVPRLKTNIDALGKNIASLRETVDGVEAGLDKMTDQQKKNWDLVKLKVQLLTIFHERKETLSSADLEKNRTTVRHLADGIAKRAKMLQQTAQKL